MSDTPSDPAPHSFTTSDGVRIRLLTRADQMTEVVDVFGQVWGSVTELLPIEMLMAIAHSGGYVGAAFEVDDSGLERIVGASVAILAHHHGHPALHSHMTGLLPGARRSGLGRALKLHQQSWARAHGIEWIVWTFDPLVRRNAWFNIAILGAEVHEYLQSFYGTMTDAINAGDESDRLLVAWNVNAGPPAEPRDGRGHPNADRIATPDDIVALRRTDSEAVKHWRSATRDAFEQALDSGSRVVGFTRDGDYVLEGAK